MKKQYKALACALLGTLLSPVAMAQNSERIQQKFLGPDNQPEMVQFSAAGKAAYRLANATQVLREQLGLTADDALLPVSQEADEVGLVHRKYSQFYKGIKVEHAEYSVHAKGDAIQSISGDFEKIENLNTTPTLRASKALARALSFVNARKYMWQDAAAEAQLKSMKGSPTATYLPAGELVVVRSLKTNEPVLAWKFDIYAQLPMSREYVYIDAHTGEEVMRDAIIKHANATGTFDTRYNYTVTSTTETTTGGYRLHDATRGNRIETKNIRNSNLLSAVVDFVDANNHWTAGEYDNAKFDNAALDVHWGTQVTYDYWKNVHGRNSYDGSGAKLASYVHFNEDPSQFASTINAGWDSQNELMVYGDGGVDGQGKVYGPLTSLDIVGHELGHAVCDKTAKLRYQNESGALNEGFSDIWGSQVEIYGGRFNKSAWTIGEDVTSGGLRSMSNPNLSSQPDTYGGRFWQPTVSNPMGGQNGNDYGGVHTNSGVLNYWFYLLSVGGSGTNDHGRTFSVAGITSSKAARIAYHAERFYLSPASYFASARTATLASATDIYGAGSAEVRAVENAWFAVGVYNNTPSYCTSKGASAATEWIDRVRIGSIDSNTGSNGGYNFFYNLGATPLAAGMQHSILYSAGFSSGNSFAENFRIYIDYNQNGVFTDAGEQIVNITTPDKWDYASTFTIPTTALTGPTRLRVVMSRASATNSCGSYSYGETEDYIVDIINGTSPVPAPVPRMATATAKAPTRGDLQLTVFPNPATDLLNVALEGRPAPLSVVITDVRGAVVATQAGPDGALRIGHLNKGIYTVTVNDGERTYHKRFVKE
ncbi:M4 family metallopeptidase [Hymenobacter saemangeumensis]